jgi:hypothetical protein
VISFDTWQQLRGSKERETVRTRFRANVNPTVVKALEDLYSLICWEMEDQIHDAFSSTKVSIEDTRSHIKGLDTVKRLLEPIIKPKV